MLPTIATGNVASATASTGYTVANSCRFNDDDSAYMHKTCSSAFDTDRWTISIWFKRGTLGIHTRLITCDNGDGSDDDYIRFDTDDKMEFMIYSGGVVGLLKPNRVFRDISAWYHLVCVWDSANGTAGNRMRMYINGVEETSFETDTNPSSGANATFGNTSHAIEIGQRGYNTSQYWDGYMAEVAVCDGQAYAASDFGEFSEDSPNIWMPKDISGLTFGTSGFYLDFEDSSNLGNDANGGTDFTEVNLAATDQATDTPTNNFCTMNPLVPTTNITFSEGNCKMATHPSSDTYGGGIGTFGLTAGKWYWEIKMASLLGNHTHGVISELTAELYQNVTGLQMDTGVTNFRNDDGGEMIKDGTQTTADYGIFDDGDIMGIAFNADDNQISIYDNGSAIVSNYAISTTRGTLFPYIGSGINTTFEVNFGGCPAFAITSGNADANGYGNMEFAVPENYYVLCSANLAEFGG